MMRDVLAAAELDDLLAHPALHGRWPDGLTTDDVLAELMALGRIGLDVRDGTPLQDDPRRFTCRVELRDEPHGFVEAEGRTLTAAAIRCLIEAEADLRCAIEQALERFSELLGER
jgi:hypothetical protein